MDLRGLQDGLLALGLLVDRGDQVVALAGHPALDGDRSVLEDLVTDGDLGAAVRGLAVHGQAGGALGLARLALGLVSSSAILMRMF